MGTGTDITLLTQQSYTAAQTIINLPIAISVLGYVGRLQKLSGKALFAFYQQDESSAKQYQTNHIGII